MKISEKYESFDEQKAAEIVKDNPDMAKIKKITLPSGTYELQEDGSYKKM